MSKEKTEKKSFVKTGLRLAGGLIAVSGAVLTVIGFYFFYRDDETLQFAAFIGVSLLIVGMFLILFSFQRELSRYKKGESLFGENAAGDNESAAADASSSTACECGAVNASDARFCKKCGKRLCAVCPFCGAEIDGDSVFCDKCGKKVEK